jgi:hypothetical protein
VSETLSANESKTACDGAGVRLSENENESDVCALNGSGIGGRICSAGCPAHGPGLDGCFDGLHEIETAFYLCVATLTYFLTVSLHLLEPISKPFCTLNEETDIPYIGLAAIGTALLHPTLSTLPPQSNPSSSRTHASASTRVIYDTKPDIPRRADVEMSEPGGGGGWVGSVRGHMIFTYWQGEFSRRKGKERTYGSDGAYAGEEHPERVFIDVCREVRNEDVCCLGKAQWRLSVGNRMSLQLDRLGLDCHFGFRMLIMAVRRVQQSERRDIPAIADTELP